MVFFAIHLSKIIIIMKKSHNPYFNRWFSAIDGIVVFVVNDGNVTILILIDGFLQLEKNKLGLLTYKSHNPYFNRWFSAIV